MFTRSWGLCFYSNSFVTAFNSLINLILTGLGMKRKFWIKLQSPTKWVETLHPKGAFWHFPDLKREKYSFPSPIPSMQCCAAVRATFRKQQTPQLWMEGTGEGSGFLCSQKLLYLSTMSQQFVGNCRLKTVH